ncbi:hypothetical protein DACRYDRAFT_115180 [Dacryopinax primogenitus]|uniref:Uncharacterized protein n=1 Tax=Dacryopinax primogenitus (strain DJM 731) TaxID=1858805 RepID=M5G5C1_DACPD|nr:uncharacterized protein DACRYDRAFT_115180 [Dacryopinax primogenitus]EJU03874.1 hypothetical protein DACRYDRAFT_115180 [Dacryopinax primogenitus]
MQMRPQPSWASFGSDSTPDEEADDHSSTGDSFDSDLMDRHIRTASTEFTGFIPSTGDRNGPLPATGTAYMPPKPKSVKGAETFPEPAAPKHLLPEMKAQAPRPHGSSRRRQANCPVAAPPGVDPVEQARIDFIRKALPPSAPPTRRSSIPGKEQTPPTRTVGKRDTLRADFHLPPRASFESRASSRAESSCPSLSKSQSSSSASSLSPSSAGSSANDLSSSKPTAPMQGSAPFKLSHASVKEGRRVSQPFAFLSRSSPPVAGAKKPSGPPTIQPKGVPPTHGPSKSASSTSLRARFNSFERGAVTPVPPVDAASLVGKNNVMSKGLGRFFKRSNKN